MVMIDRIIKIEGMVTETGFTILPDNVFTEDGYFTEPGLIENMAQTAAAGAGARPGVEEGKAPLGFIGGIRNLQIHKLPPVGSTLLTRTTVEHEVFDATVVRGESFINHELIASCELKIFLIPEPTSNTRS